MDGSLLVHIQTPLSPPLFQGSLATTMSLQSMGECSGSGVCVQSSITNTYESYNGDGSIDQTTCKTSYINCDDPGTTDCFTVTLAGPSEPTMDCHGDYGGTAYMSSCGCIGGNTGIDVCPETTVGGVPVNIGQGASTVVYNPSHCMHGGQSKTNNIATYNITGGNNDVFAAFNSTIAIDNDGDPNCDTLIDPYYQSQTSYTTGLPGQANYLDGTQVAYIALNIPYFQNTLGIHIDKGDIVALTNSSTGAIVYAIIGDSGNTNEVGEMSLKAALDLGFTASRTSASAADHVNIHVFLNSTLSGPVTQQQINTLGASLAANNPGINLADGPPTGISPTCSK